MVNEFEQVLHLVASIVFWIFDRTLDLLCTALLVASLILPWRLVVFCCSGGIIIDREGRKNYRSICIESVKVSFFDLFVFPFFIAGLITVVRAPLVLHAALCSSEKDVDLSLGLGVSWDKRRRIVEHGVLGVINVVCMLLGAIALCVPTCTAGLPS